MDANAAPRPLAAPNGTTMPSPHMPSPHMPHGQQPQLSRQSSSNSIPAPSPQLSNQQAPKLDSPEVQATTRDLKFSDDYTALSGLLKRTSPNIIRQVVRDNWERCFLGSSYHLLFLLNTAIQQTPPGTLGKVIEESGKRLVQHAKDQLINHLTADDLDQASESILAKASPQFLDRALALRLETIEARNLVNVLARAERLGYDVQDIVEENENGAETVIPSLQGLDTAPHYVAPSQTQAARQAPGASKPTMVGPRVQSKKGTLPHHAHPQPLPTQIKVPAFQPETGVHYCQDCGRPCTGQSALAYHSKKGACDRRFDLDKLEKNICLHCGCTFGSATGTQYHMKSGVCAQYSDSQTVHMRRELEGFARYVRQSDPPRKLQQPHSASGPSGPSTPKEAAPRSTGTLVAGCDAEAVLKPDAFIRFRDEVRATEAKYGQLIREAMLLPEPESTDRISRAKNSYNTKLSTTRKKYGLRLTERRTKEDLEEERIRLLHVPNANEVWMAQEKAAMHLKTNPASFVASIPSWVKTSREGIAEALGDSPRKRVRLSEMGGLTGSVGSAETTDPTAHLTSSQPRGAGQVPPPRTGAAASHGQQTGDRDDPMAIDLEEDNDDSDEGNEGIGEGKGSSDNSSTDSNEDIPARL